MRDVFFRAIKNNDALRLKELIALGYDINATDKMNRSPLSVACANRDGIKCIRLLIRKGADINKMDTSGGIALGWAISSSNTDAIELLIKAGVNIHQHYHINEYTNGEPIITNALIHTISCIRKSYVSDLNVQEFLKCAYLLINQGINIDDKTNFGQTALMVAARLKSYKMTKKLIELNADQYIKDNEGMTAFNYSKNNFIENIIAEVESEKLALLIDTQTNCNHNNLLF